MPSIVQLVALLAGRLSAEFNALRVQLNAERAIAVTRAEFEILAGAAGLTPGRSYLITDEERVLVAFGASTFITLAKVQDTYGPEFLVDGLEFASGYAGISGTSNYGGKISLTATAFPRANLDLTGPLKVGRLYELIYTISNYTAGTIRIVAGNVLTSRSANNTYTERFTASSPATSLQVQGPSGGRGSLEMVSLREVNPPPPELADLTWIGGMPSAPEEIAEGGLIGSITGQTDGSALVLVGDAGGRVALSGNNIVRGPTALDYETVTSHEITLREMLADASNSPRYTVLTFSVTDVSVTLADLEWFTGGATAARVNGSQGSRVEVLTNDTTGGTLSLVDDAGGRFQLEANDVQFGPVPTSAGTYEITVRETHPEGSNSPRDTVLEIVIT